MNELHIEDLSGFVFDEITARNANGLPIDQDFLADLIAEWAVGLNEGN